MFTKMVNEGQAKFTKMVLNPYSPVRCNSGMSRLKPPPAHLPNRIWALRFARGRSREELAARMGDNHQTLEKYEKGQRKLSLDVMRKIAAALDMPEDPWGLLNDEDRPRYPPPPQVPLIGYVGAGEMVFPFPDDEAEGLAVAPFDCESGFAVRVRGESMLPVYRDGELLFAEPVTSPAQALRRDCIVQVRDGPRLVKRLMPGTRPDTFRLFSYNTLSETADMSLTDIAVIRWVRRV